jgi:dihydrofolate synthase/folylpolyglutamate synthase
MQNIIRYLESKKNSNNIELIKRALEALRLEIDPTKVIIVAGTNGKGSTCATLQKLLMASGKNVGFFSSPHLIKINERIKLNDQDILDEDFCKIFNAVHEKVCDFHLSYFEYLTLMAAHYFFTVKNVDFAIFEVGLGGSYDASNAIPHDTSVITKLGLDHESILGDDTLKIAQNKLGIVSSGNKVFHTKFYNEEIIQLSQSIAKKFRANFIEAYAYDCVIDTTGKYPLFGIKTQWGDFKMNLQGRRAAENTSLAATIFDYLVDDDVQQFLPAIAEVNWPGRMEMIYHKNRDVFLSGDHNPQGIQSLLDILQFYNFKNVHFVVGICNDKRHSEMLQELANFRNSNLYLTETPEKTLPLKGYDEIFRKSARFALANPFEALDAAISNAEEEDLIVVTGSLYLIGKIKSLIQRIHR